MENLFLLSCGFSSSGRPDLSLLLTPSKPAFAHKPGRAAACFLGLLASVAEELCSLLTLSFCSSPPPQWRLDRTRDPSPGWPAKPQRRPMPIRNSFLETTTLFPEFHLHMCTTADTHMLNTCPKPPYKQGTYIYTDACTHIYPQNTYNFKDIHTKPTYLHIYKHINLTVSYRISYYKHTTHVRTNAHTQKQYTHAHI